MNKTTEVFESENSNYSSTSVERALKLAGKALGCSQQHLDLYHPEWVITRQQNDKALAAIREARAEQEKQERRELTYEQYLGLAKDADILVAHEHYNLNEQDTKKAWVVEYGKLVYSKAWLDGFESIQPEKQESFMCEPVPPVSEDGWTDWVCPTPQGYLMQCCDCGLIHEVDTRVAKYEPRPSEEFEVVDDLDMQCQWRMRRRDDLSSPVKQEPVAIVDEIGLRVDGTHIFNAIGKVEVGQPLYAAPVDAKAIRAEALEEAEERVTELYTNMEFPFLPDITAAIRGLK